MTVALRGPGVAACLVALATGAAVAAPAPAPGVGGSWLSVRAVDPAESVVDDRWIGIEAERAAESIEQGFGTIERLVRHELHVDADRVLRTRYVRVRHFVDEGGIQREGDLRFRTRYLDQSVTIEEAWVAMPDGTRRPVDLSRVQVLTTGEDGIFSDTVEVVLPYEGLVPGATAVLVTTGEESLSDWPLPWSHLFLPQRWSPVDRFDLELSWDPALPAHMLTSDSDLVSCDEGPTSWTCHGDDLAPVPAAGETPIWLDVVPHIVVGEPHSWAELIEAERRLVERSAAEADGVDAIVRRLIDGAGSERERLRALYRFVADEIRYVALEHGVEAVVPAPASRTLDLRYGDCKGKVALLLALAEHAGITAYPVLVSTGRNELGKLVAPSWRFFDHMIVCAEPDGGAVVCMDPTALRVPLEHLPIALYGSVALELRPGVDAPTRIEIPHYVWDVAVTAVNRFRCDGTIEERLVREYRGPTAAWQRASLDGLSREDLTRWASDSYAEVMAGAEPLPEIEFEGLDDPAAPVRVTTSTEWEQALSAGTRDYVEEDAWLNHLGWQLWTRNEVYPAFVLGARLETSLRYEPCADDSVDLVGATLDFDSEFGRLTRSYRHVERGVEVSTVLEVYPQTVRGEDLPRYRRFLGGVLDQTGIWFRFEEPIAARSEP